LVEKFDPVETAKTLERLDVRKSNIAISSRTLPPGIEGDFDLVEPIYSTKYKKIKMSQAFIDEALNGTVPELHLPGKNAFIPENLDVKKIEVESPKLAPELIQETPLSKLWYKKDDRYWIPRANVFMSLKSYVYVYRFITAFLKLITDTDLIRPLLQVTPRNAVLARIFVDMFKDSIAEETYDAELAGLQFSLDYSGDRLIVGTVGYNDKLYALTEKILRTLKSFKVDPTRFELIRDQVSTSTGSLV
jgi:insulysin